MGKAGRRQRQLPFWPAVAATLVVAVLIEVVRWSFNLPLFEVWWGRLPITFLLLGLALFIVGRLFSEEADRGNSEVSND